MWPAVRMETEVIVRVGYFFGGIDRGARLAADGLTATAVFTQP